MGKVTSDPELNGRNEVQQCILRYKLGQVPYIYISIPKLWEKGYYPDFDLIQSLEAQSDIVISFPHIVSKAERNSLQTLALDLSTEHKVLVHEAALELGGGADVPQQLVFVYQEFQPVITLIGNLAASVVASMIYDIIKSIYKKKNNPLLDSQYTIQRQLNGITYNYVFDNLTVDQALLAVKQIPSKQFRKYASYDSIYLRYDAIKNAWISFKPRQ